MRRHATRLGTLLVLLLVMARAAAFDLQGHRGARGLAPENTLPAFARALAIGVTTLELDRASDTPGTVSVEGGTLVWSFPVPEATGQPSPVAELHLDGRATGRDEIGRAHV